MRKTTYQIPEIRDENNNIIQEGTFGRRTAFVTADNHGVLDYLINNLEALRDIVTGAYITFESRAGFPTAGDSTKIYVSRADGKVYRWNGTDYEYIDVEAMAATALDVKKMKEKAEDSASAAASSAADAGSSASNASSYAAEAEVSRKAAKQSAQNCADLYAKAQTATGKPYLFLNSQGNISIRYELDTTEAEG